MVRPPPDRGTIMLSLYRGPAVPTKSTGRHGRALPARGAPASRKSANFLSRRGRAAEVTGYGNADGQQLGGVRGPDRAGPGGGPGGPQRPLLPAPRPALPHGGAAPRHAPPGPYRRLRRGARGLRRGGPAPRRVPARAEAPPVPVAAAGGRR